MHILIKPLKESLNKIDEYLNDMESMMSTWTDGHSYNGWHNYATWNIALWFDNDEDLYEYKLNLTEQARNISSDKNDQIYHLAEQIKDYLETKYFDIRQNNPYHEYMMDILHDAVLSVHYGEIARAWLEE